MSQITWKSKQFSNLCTIIFGISLFIFSAQGRAVFNYTQQNNAFWQQHLAPEVYDICRSAGTEAAGSGKYDHFYESGTYYCACCGGDFPLFSSKTKFDSKTGWPSFYAPIPNAVIERPDPNDKISGIFNTARTEVLCARCESHLGHVFDDGPKPTGLRYCMNSLALVFFPTGEQPKRTYQVN